MLTSKFLQKFSPLFVFLARKKVSKKFSLLLRQADIDVKAEKYFAMCYASSFFSFIFFSIIFAILFKIFFLPIIYSFFISFFVSVFLYIRQINYPKLLVMRRTRNIEKNLLPALRALLVQLNSGLTFFDSLDNIAKSNYGAVSKEFAKAVKDMQMGISATDALEKISSANPSLFFRRVLWQIITGMRAGSDISVVLKEIINALSTEQITEIQGYGARLSPLTMFYMLVAIILPSLGITFIIVLSSFLPILNKSSKIILISMLFVVVILQIMFMGMIKTRRPALA